MRPYARVRKLASEEREELERMERSRKPAAGRARRAEIVLLSDRGYTAEEIGKRLGCHQETASRWIDRFNRLGLAGLEGGPPEAAGSAGGSCVGGPAGVAERWFERVRVDGEIMLLYEPHAHELLRSNVWHVRGKDRDLLVDAGLGAASLREAYPDLFERDPLLVLTHAHYDHAGGAHEFTERWIHELEAPRLAEPGFGTLSGAVLPAERRREMAQMGMPIDGDLIDALPREGYDVRSYRVVPAPATRTLAEGDAIDLGDRRFAVLHLPGHSPDSIGLWEEETGLLFSGDAVYDGPLLDELPGSDVAAYVRTMRRLRELPVSVVHAGHDPSFGGRRLREIAERYLAWRAK